MRRKIIVVFILSILLSPCVIFDYSSGDDTDYLRLSAVFPTSSSEGFALHNYGTTYIDLIDYHLTDGEGTLTFTESVIINPGQSLYFLKGEPPVWLNDVTFLIYGTSGIKTRSFTLSDNGDDLYLYHNDTLIDSFVYGNSSGSINGWIGDPFDKIPKNRIAERISYVDTDTKEDWTVSNHMSLFNPPDAGYQAEVIPFTFPESKGEQVFSELIDAVSSVDISVYLINHPTVISILDELLTKGVDIRILIEGAPAGGISDDELGLLTALYRHGADIRVIHSGDFGKRFNYLHNKYAIIDQESVVMTSENWQQVSFESNRGWGAVIRSSEYANFLEQVFEYDFYGYDTDSLNSLYPKVKPYSIDSYSIGSTAFQSFNCTVYPVLSPDNSLNSLKEFILSAEEKIYIQQLEVESDWLEETDNPLSWVMERSFEGLDCRLMISSAFDDEQSVDSGSYYIQGELENYDLQCRLYSGSGLLHNKGILTEDSVWLGSVNWTDNSLNYNRETAIIIDSSVVSDYFRSFFINDWGEDIDSPLEINLIYEDIIISGKTVLLDASESIAGSGSVFYWDLDNDGVYERSGKKIPAVFSAGINDISLRIVCGDVSCDESFQITALESNGSMEIPWRYVPFILLCIAIIIISIHRRDMNDR